MESRVRCLPGSAERRPQCVDGKAAAINMRHCNVAPSDQPRIAIVKPLSFLNPDQTHKFLNFNSLIRQLMIEFFIKN